MTEPLVSIIIPCYNAEKYVAESIQSALDQTYPHCEVIVIDDGSTDGSLDVIKSFGDRIRWETGPNHGGCAARNRGLELAKGEWIQFLDSDDLLDANCVMRKLECKRGGEEIVCCKVGVVDGHDGSSIAKWQADGFDVMSVLVASTPQTAAPLHQRKDLMDIGGFDESLPCSQEYNLHIRLVFLAGKKFKVVPYIGVYIRPLDDSVSRSPGVPIMQSRIKSVLGLEREMHRRGLMDGEKKNAMALALAVYSRQLFRAGDRLTATEMMKRARALDKKHGDLAYRSKWVATAARLTGYSFYERLNVILAKTLKRKFGVCRASPKRG